MVQFCLWICIQYYHQPQDVLERSQLPSGIFAPPTIYNTTACLQCGRVWWWPGPCLVVTPHCEKLFWIRPQTQRTTTCSVTHQPMGHIRGTNSCLDRENIYTIYMLSLYMPPYSIFTQRFREYWNYGNGIKMCTGGTSYILQECSYKDIIQLQDLHNIIIFDLSIENCSGVKTPF